MRKVHSCAWCNQYLVSVIIEARSPTRELWFCIGTQFLHLWPLIPVIDLFLHVTTLAWCLLSHKINRNSQCYHILPRVCSLTQCAFVIYLKDIPIMDWIALQVFYVLFLLLLKTVCIFNIYYTLYRDKQWNKQSTHSILCAYVLINYLHNW